MPGPRKYPNLDNTNSLQIQNVENVEKEKSVSFLQSQDSTLHRGVNDVDVDVDVDISGLPATDSEVKPESVVRKSRLRKPISDKGIKASKSIKISLDLYRLLNLERDRLSSIGVKCTSISDVIKYYLSLGEKSIDKKTLEYYKYLNIY